MKKLFVVCLMVFIVSAASAYTITSATLVGPAQIICPPNNHATYTITLTGTGQSDTIASWLNFAVYDDDWGIDDCLQNETVFNILGDGQQTGNWIKILTFELWCEDHKIRGLYESSGEASCQVYSLIEDSIGSDLITTNTITVTCVPEPTTICLLGLGVLSLVRRKK